jgi:microcompartment protein CcmL/EutN
MSTVWAMGMIETRGLIGAIEAADAAAKTADVQLLMKERTGGGLVTVRFVGETAAVQEATRAGGEAAARVGQLITTHVIARLDDETARMLHLTENEYAGMPVAELRALARELPDFPARGRELNRLTREQLVELLAAQAKQRGHK